LFKPTKSKLSIFFLVLTFLPLIVMRLVVYPITFQALKDEIIKNLEGAVQKQTELITKWMEERTADVQRIANNPFVLLVMQSIAGSTEHADLVKNMETIKYFDYLWKEYGSKEIFIADREGVVRIASRKEIVGTNISTKDYFRSSIKGAFFTSNIIPSDVPVENESGILEVGVPTMLISAPIKDRSNSVVGTMALRIDVSEINTMMQNIHIGKTGETYLINGDGYILTESKFVEDLKGQHRVIKRSALELKVANPLTNVATKGVLECLKGSEGFDADGYSDYRGVNVILRDYILFTFGLVAVGVIIVAFFLGKKISAPISYITETAREIAGGSYHVRAQYKAGDEIGELAGAINTMAETLESRSQMFEPTNPPKLKGEI